MDISTWIAIVGTAWAVVCAVLAWVFATGRWTQRHEQSHKEHVTRFADIERQFQEIRHQLIALRGECSDARRMISFEDDKRREVIDRVNVNIGKISSRLNVLYREIGLRVEMSNTELANMKRQLERTEEYARSLQRQIDQKR